MTLADLRPSISQLPDEEILSIVQTIRDRRRQSAQDKIGKVKATKTVLARSMASAVLDKLSDDDLQALLKRIEERKSGKGDICNSGVG